MAYDFNTQARAYAGQTTSPVRIFSHRKSAARRTAQNGAGLLLLGHGQRVAACSGAGTRIATPRGEVRIEHLRSGDRVITRDNGLAALRWVGTRRVAVSQGARHLTAIRIPKGALGNDLPEREMIVSPNQRLVVARDKTALYFEDGDALVAAKHLTGLAGVKPVQEADAVYFHLMFDQTEVILSNGVWSESFSTMAPAQAQGGNAQRTELSELYPAIGTPAQVS